MGEQLRWTEELYHIFHTSSLSYNYSRSYNLYFCSAFVPPDTAGGNRLPTCAAQGRRQRSRILHVYLRHLAGGCVDVVSYAAITP